MIKNKRGNIITSHHILYICRVEKNRNQSSNPKPD